MNTPDSLSNLIDQQNLVIKRNPKAELKDLLTEECNNLKLRWVLAHIGIKGNKEADEAVE
jgi:ribonuclease HI